MKKWYESKMAWLGIITTVLGVLPLIGVYVEAVAPEVAAVAGATIALISGVLTVVLRVWFTDTAIER